MTTTQHTPGPWYSKVVAWNTGFKIVDETGASIAAYSSAGKRPQAESASNALLIAAAPDLLEALKAYQTAVATGIDADPALWSRAALLTEAAIAKAEGR